MTRSNQSIHTPVMVYESLLYLEASKGGIFLDCTFGGGGHTEAILESNPKNKVVAIDRDMRAVVRGIEKFSGKPVEIYHSKFSEVLDVVNGQTFDGILADIGISTDQLKENRGFSFNDDILDMRMDESSEFTAKDLVNEADESTILETLREGGAGKVAKTAASVIIKNRPFESSRELSKKLNQVLVGKSGKITNPSTVVFQAIRIAVNREFFELDQLLKISPSLIKGGGRLVVINFHSDEDKLVARKMRSWEGGEFSASWAGKSIEKPALGKLLTRKAVTPSDDEIKTNPSSRSARLRAFRFNEVFKTVIN